MFIESHLWLRSQSDKVTLIQNMDDDQIPGTPRRVQNLFSVKLTECAQIG